MKIPLLLLGAAACACAIALTVSPARAAEVPDNGFGTATMPILLPYDGLSPMHIIAGLPGGSQINIDATLTSPTATIEEPGGSLGGTRSGAEVTWSWEMQGTGAYAGYTRSLILPLSSIGAFPGLPNAGIEVHAAPRMLGAPVQSYDTDLARMFGQIVGDPDFDLLRIVAGTDFGLPSPGHTTLTQSGSNWSVDSFFDITYRIDFVGRPGGPFSGMSGSTTDTVRIVAVPEPGSVALLAVGAAALLVRRRRL